MSDIQSRVEVLRPKVGDTIAVSVPGPLSAQQREHITRACAGQLPAGVKVLVLDSRISLTHVVNPELAPAAHPAEAKGFEAWMRERTERAHAEFMERTSRRLQCDWTTEDIARYFGAPQP